MVSAIQQERETGLAPRPCCECGCNLRMENRERGVCDPCARRLAEEAEAKLQKEAELKRNRAEERQARRAYRDGLCKKAGHDTRVLGKYKDGRCAECARLQKREHTDKKRVEAGLPPFDFSTRVECRGLAKLLNERGIKSAAFAGELGIKKQTFNEYKKCRFRCSGDLARRMAEVLGVSLDQLKGEG